MELLVGIMEGKIGLLVEGDCIGILIGMFPGCDVGDLGPGACNGVAVGSWFGNVVGNFD